MKIDINYNPLPKQLEFHRNPAKYRLYIGAWRAGKTYAGCMEAFKQSINNPNNRGVICRRDYTDLLQTTAKTLFEIIPEQIIESYNKSEHYIKLRNGSEIYLRHLKDGLKLGSLDLGWAYIDEAEEVDEQVFQYLKGRLSKTGVKRNCLWLTSNPPNTDHWLHKLFVDNIDDEDIALIHASTYENKNNLPVDYIISLEKMPPSWRKKYLEGHFGFTPDGKPFYEGFKEYLHKLKLKVIAENKIYRSWDFGFHHPAVSFHQIDNKGRWHIVDEVMGTDITIQRFGEYIKTYCKQNYSFAIYEDFGDPAGKQKNDKSEITSVEVLASMGIFISSKPSTYRERKEIIERKLSSLIDGLPALLVNEKCKTIIDGFNGGYHYPTIKKGASFNPSIMEAPFRDSFYEHLMNTVEYFAVNMFEGAETKDIDDDVHIKIVGDHKDIHIDTDDDEDKSGQYRRWQNNIYQEA